MERSVQIVNWQSKSDDSRFRRSRGLFQYDIRSDEEKRQASEQNPCEYGCTSYPPDRRQPEKIEEDEKIPTIRSGNNGCDHAFAAFEINSLRRQQLLPRTYDMLACGYRYFQVLADLELSSEYSIYIDAGMPRPARPYPRSTNTNSRQTLLHTSSFLLLVSQIQNQAHFGFSQPQFARYLAYGHSRIAVFVDEQVQRWYVVAVDRENRRRRRDRNRCG